jgi:lipopolysaccharide biosynthesis glycosyltransferase
MDSSLLANLAVSERISTVTYSWNVMAEIINPDVDRLIYMDGDMIVLNDIRPLWETDMNGCIIAAVDDIAAMKFKEYDRLNIPEKFGYFNSGVILIDRKQWVKNDFSNKVLTYARENAEILKFQDQDAGNAVLKDRRKALDQKWNQQVGIYFLRKKFLNSIYSEEAVEEIKNNPVIVHFNGHEKPWDYANLHPYKNKFNYFLEISKIQKPKEKISLRKTAKKLVYRIFGWNWWNRV